MRRKLTWPESDNEFKAYLATPGLGASLYVMVCRRTHDFPDVETLEELVEYHRACGAAPSWIVKATHRWAQFEKWKKKRNTARN